MIQGCFLPSQTWIIFHLNTDAHTLRLHAGSHVWKCMIKHHLRLWLSFCFLVIIWGLKSPSNRLWSEAFPSHTHRYPYAVTQKRVLIIKHASSRIKQTHTQKQQYCKNDSFSPIFIYHILRIACTEPDTAFHLFSKSLDMFMISKNKQGVFVVRSK